MFNLASVKNLPCSTLKIRVFRLYKVVTLRILTVQQGGYFTEARLNTDLTHHFSPSTLACLCSAQKFPYPQFPCHQRFSGFISWFKFNDKNLKMYQTITTLKILNDIIVYKQLNLNHENRRNWENFKYRRSYSIVKFSKCLW